MGMKVLKLENKKRGSYEFETTDARGKVTFQANGVIREISPTWKITRTFEPENSPFGVQLKVYEFEKVTHDTSKLNMHLIYESDAQRDQVLKIGMAQGMNMTHNRIQEIVSKLR